MKKRMMKYGKIYMANVSSIDTMLSIVDVLI